ncbi:hypothetical protein EA758_19310 [Acinetobacter pittii]|uniref:Uncharacterized protein n=2 Tax=Acinetobacter pittii TaxID=48296 RepID=A0A429JU94_ACIPI|nr:hypothetical protein APD36_00110 [Acinetobacter pittii]KQF17251.1 hypothetical protein APC05_02965 [Acinetobacter pittii]KRI47577.1 hypothetical protein APC42_10550 [Acinetobacter pittii]OTL80482.1 hypothetical protein B9X62_18385 [Acinetobacter pittii]OTU36152.1 hypothetical protein CAT58_08935 [Acinetobacter pittii]
MNKFFIHKSDLLIFIIPTLYFIKTPISTISYFRSYRQNRGQTCINESFVSKAPTAVFEGEKAELAALLQEVKANMKQITAL